MGESLARTRRRGSGGGFPPSFARRHRPARRADGRVPREGRLRHDRPLRLAACRVARHRRGPRRRHTDEPLQGAAALPRRCGLQLPCLRAGFPRPREPLHRAPLRRRPDARLALVRQRGEPRELGHRALQGVREPGAAEVAGMAGGATHREPRIREGSGHPARRRARNTEGRPRGGL